MKINFFSPLPGLATDIANMSASVLPELAAIAEVRAWTPQHEWRDGIDKGFEIRRFDPDNLPIREFNWADVNFFNVGNNALFHRDIFNVARKIPGVMILHDVRLAHFFGAYSERESVDHAYYISEMDKVGLGQAARRLVAGEIPFSTIADLEPMTQAALRPALAGIIHNRTEMEPLLDNRTVPLFYVPLCLAKAMRPAPLEDSRTFSEGSPIRLVVFGFIGGNRCIAEILQAIAGLPQRRSYTLDIYGTFEHPEPVEKLIGELGLEDQVTCHGFVSDATLDEGLEQADLAINLRNPTMGEASGSQLRIWENALPSLVSDVGWYSELSSDVVRHVRPGNEVSELQAYFREFRQFPQRFRKAGRQGRALLERDHHPASYAQSLLDIAEQAPELHSRHLAMWLARQSAMKIAKGVSNPASFTQGTALAERIQQLVKVPSSAAHTKAAS
ncbi:glycosyltransferase [Lichenicola cladoniae]|uniref:Glycosyltransferase n=1 Tax=Lichenicola cladoniae TaxID=1484109 RepID=A0A6M8HV38_9PROT|nr:glycosyltransferase [Lichenicola cladoniae]NPD66172.1 glycosyltransferase [Acetobacteraceae bacterium]QKE92035.1 glycosyltransferase [Lichenicola cladoniae]